MLTKSGVDEMGRIEEQGSDLEVFIAQWGSLNTGSRLQNLRQIVQHMGVATLEELKGLTAPQVQDLPIPIGLKQYIISELLPESR
eukprot:CAMPEP_0177671194 /NCGR_PEP_ID=MMETSP0447-20121125/24559_1 /TAXON_ID=0 /ORGANISM="Stygamoeba regulata, Strain BSH-02190019" /LENGTH=84 /DNA_ID=CAMNT_0019178541 /DNA_START=1 /DNA_END=251 /DNA_ORIENTATION=+